MKANPRKEKNVRRIAVLMLLALLLGACSTAAKPSDPAVVIETSPGKEFKVVLESNPTTGYHWELVGEVDENVVGFVSRDYRADTPQTTGSGGVDIWVFKAAAAGETQITLGYYPPSNTPTDPDQTETFTVRVK